ncbi:MAG: UDP-N-acetylmuramoyl-L-alanine--D-glutamate ligase [Gammaproteobacteria bacterium]
MAKRATRALIVGLGETGLSSARYLISRGYQVAVTDSRARPPALERLRNEAPNVAAFLGEFSADALRRADMVVVSPGLPSDLPFLKLARDMDLPVVGDVELFAREVNAPVVAVTGSNGKSTVATLVGLMGQRSGRATLTGGNLGPPALDLLAGEPADLYVLELSSFQLEMTDSLHTAAAALLNITADHLDRYPDMAAYAAAKERIFNNAEVCVFNRQDPAVAAAAHRCSRAWSFGLDTPPGENDFGLVERHSRAWLALGDRALIPADELKIQGHHNLANALAALALGRAAGLDEAAMLETLRDFRGLPHRVQWVGEKDGVLFINDSKGTNVGATVAAVAGIRRPLVLIAGGDAKGADFSPLVEAMAGRVHDLVLIGRDAGRIAAAVGERIPVHHVTDMFAAVRQAASLAQPGDAVVLSPACASLDMYRNYAHRGEVFMEAVREVIE